jgi:hypothetical protein
VLMGKQQLERHLIERVGEGSLKQVMNKMKSWFQGNF